MKAFILACVLIAVAYAKSIMTDGVVVGDIWSDCTKPDDKGTVNSVVISPDPPIRGKSLSINATFTLKEEVTGGNVAIKMKWGEFPIYDQTINLCDLIKDVGKECPLPAKTQQIITSVNFPSDTPTGHFIGTAIVTDQNGYEVVCVNLDFKF
jgi:hypothetical protein